MSLKFVPPKQVAKYALFVDYGNERGYFKVYDELGSAKNAHHHRNYGTRNNAKILEQVDGEWYVLHDIVAGTSYEDLPWVKEVNVGGWYSKRKVTRATPMSREEYAEWRIAVERERINEQVKAPNHSFQTFNK